MSKESAKMQWGSENMTAKNAHECNRLESLLEPYKHQKDFPNMGKDDSVPGKVTFSDIAASDKATFGRFTYASFCNQVRRVGNRLKGNDERKKGNLIFTLQYFFCT